MSWMKRIFLFLALNFVVVLTLSFFLHLFGVQPYLTRYGLDVRSLMAFCLIWGIGGALISLSLSRIMAKWMMGISLVDETNTDSEARKLFSTVSTLAYRAGIPVPQVGIYSSNEVNAFATGPTQSRSLVAVSSGLLRRMKDEEIEAVLGHEISHIANGDMVTMTLLQGVVNAFVMFLARILAYAISQNSRRSEQSGISGSYFLFVYLFEILFLVLGSLITSAFSRYREYRADQGGAMLTNKQAMISALHTLKVLSEVKDPSQKAQEAVAAFKISRPKIRGWLHWFSTHPPIDKRIERLQAL